MKCVVLAVLIYELFDLHLYVETDLSLVSFRDGQTFVVSVRKLRNQREGQP